MSWFRTHACLYRLSIRKRRRHDFGSVSLRRTPSRESREEIQQQLWGTDTIVDFDHSLGTAINKLREALGDSAENPRFIETLARRGYRFIAPVTVVGGGAARRSSAETEPTLGVVAMAGAHAVRADAEAT